jgi:hypothetical protein
LLTAVSFNRRSVDPNNANCKASQSRPEDGSQGQGREGKWGNSPKSPRYPSARPEGWKQNPSPSRTTGTSGSTQWAAQFSSDIAKAIEALVMAVSGYDGVIQSKLSLSARQELVRKFAKAMGVLLEI